MMMLTIIPSLADARCRCTKPEDNVCIGASATIIPSHNSNACSISISINMNIRKYNSKYLEVDLRLYVFDVIHMAPHGKPNVCFKFY